MKTVPDSKIYDWIEHVESTGETLKLTEISWLVRGDELIEEQKHWVEADEAKHRVFDPKCVYFQVDCNIEEAYAPEIIEYLSQEVCLIND